MESFSSFNDDIPPLVFSTGSKVRLNLLPEVEPISPVPQPPEVRVHNNRGSDTEICIFHANVTSFSQHTKDYIFNLPKHVSAISLNELHETEPLVLEDKFKKHGFRAYCNPAEPSASSAQGTHGGELVATRSHFLSTPVMPELLEELACQFLVPLRFPPVCLGLKSYQCYFALFISGARKAFRRGT